MTSHTLNFVAVFPSVIPLLRLYFIPLLIAFASPLYPQMLRICSSHCIPTFASPVAMHLCSLRSPVYEGLIPWLLENIILKKHLTKKP